MPQTPTQIQRPPQQTPTGQTRFSFSINTIKAENGYVISLNSRGAAKQFVAKDFAELKNILTTFVNALEEPTPNG